MPRPTIGISMFRGRLTFQIDVIGQTVHLVHSLEMGSNNMLPSLITIKHIPCLSYSKLPLRRLEEASYDSSVFHTYDDSRGDQSRQP